MIELGAHGSLRGDVFTGRLGARTFHFFQDDGFGAVAQRLVGGAFIGQDARRVGEGVGSGMIVHERFEAIEHLALGRDILRGVRPGDEQRRAPRRQRDGFIVRLRPFLQQVDGVGFTEERENLKKLDVAVAHPVPELRLDIDQLRIQRDELARQRRGLGRDGGAGLGIEQGRRREQFGQCPTDSLAILKNLLGRAPGGRLVRQIGRLREGDGGRAAENDEKTGDAIHLGAPCRVCGGPQYANHMRPTC